MAEKTTKLVTRKNEIEDGTTIYDVSITDDNIKFLLAAVEKFNTLEEIYQEFAKTVSYIGDHKYNLAKEGGVIEKVVSVKHMPSKTGVQNKLSNMMMTGVLTAKTLTAYEKSTSAATPKDSPSYTTRGIVLSYGMLAAAAKKEGFELDNFITIGDNFIIDMDKKKNTITLSKKSNK